MLATTIAAMTMRMYVAAYAAYLVCLAFSQWLAILRSPAQRFQGTGGEEQSQDNYREIKNSILDVEDTSAKRVEVGDHRHVREHPRPRRGLVSPDPLQNPEQQTYSEGCGSRDDLILRKRRDKGADRQQRARLEQQAEIAHGQRFPVRVTVLEEKCEVHSGEQEQAGIEDQCRQPLSDDDFQIAYGGCSQQFDGAGSFLFCE